MEGHVISTERDAASYGRAAIISDVLDVEDATDMDVGNLGFVRYRRHTLSPPFLGRRVI